MGSRGAADERPRPRRMPDITIKVDSVTKIYDGRTVLDQIKLDVFSGETLVILGGSGSGNGVVPALTASDNARTR